LTADDPRSVDLTGQLVDVDGVNVADDAYAVAAEDRRLVFAVPLP
jgi:hypothetical protein